MPLISDPCTITDVTVLLPKGCGSFCDPQVKAVFAMVSTLEAGQRANLYINSEGGELEQWDAHVNLDGWDAGAADGIIGFDQFVCIVSRVEQAIIRSDDRGGTQVEIGAAVVTEFNPNGPECIDAIDMTYIVVGGENGYIYLSTDAARTWEVIDAGLATANNITRIEIARDNPLVVYGIAGTEMVKTTNGGDTWDNPLTVPGTTLTALWVKDQNHVLVGDNAGGIWETSDGGATWTQQVNPPDWIAAHDISDICGCAKCGVAWMAVTEAAGSAHIIYRNVDGGADGRWYIPTGGDDISHPLYSIAQASANRAVAGGGTGTTAGNVVLLA